MSQVCYAQCVAEIKDAKEGDSGSVLVGVDFILNNEVEPHRDWFSFFPEELYGITNQEKLKLLKKKVDARCEELILREYIKTNDFPINEERKTISPSEVEKIKSNCIGMKSTIEYAVFEMDINGDGVNDKEIKPLVEKATGYFSNNLFTVRQELPEKEFKKPDKSSDNWVALPCDSPLLTYTILKLGLESKDLNKSANEIKNKWDSCILWKVDD